MQLLFGILLPFFGTAAGAAAVYVMNTQTPGPLQQSLSGFAAGVMTAASVWSLMLPAISQSASMGALAFVPAAVGFWCGALFLRLLDRASTRLSGSDCFDGIEARTGKMLFAVVLHNLPEGIAVGVGFAGALAGRGVTMAAAMVLSLGIAIQNLPEGAIVSMPLAAAGWSKRKACRYGVLSGAVEPVGAALTLAAASVMTPLLPYLLSFAAGVMLLVVAQELAPELERSRAGALLFTFGFTLMMALDVALG